MEYAEPIQRQVLLTLLNQCFQMLKNRNSTIGSPVTALMLPMDSLRLVVRHQLK
jgi:hypothetical protein